MLKVSKRFLFKHSYFGVLLAQWQVAQYFSSLQQYLMVGNLISLSTGRTSSSYPNPSHLTGKRPILIQPNQNLRFRFLVVHIGIRTRDQDPRFFQTNYPSPILRILCVRRCVGASRLL